MKALTVAQPWASLIVAGAKTIETRPSPPNGPLRPDGVRGLPGKAIERGERIAIHAAATLPDVFDPETRGGWFYLHRATGEQLIRHPDHGDMAAPLGAIVGTVVVASAVPIVDDVAARNCIDIRQGCPEAGMALRLHGTTEERVRASDRPETITDLGDQLPLGDYRPGRWGWLLTDPKPTTVECPSDCARAPEVVAGHCVSIDGEWWHEPGSCACGMAGGCCQPPCSTCGGAGRCDPVPVRGRQGVWEWTP